ncbi:YutD family protein [Macrococcus armenti]|uniref:YutD family protein n=1 Tax=Macrococcus armenti TaxID=2875764 RepID=A0ABY3ZXP2_9STAP|nr:YutD family protein [Macrococcus armenti]UOB21567.1 YutD family protein [Macrococcus armenti]
MIQTGQHYFEVIENHKDAFNQEMFDHRYSEILDRYPYIVGDIGYEQLRLRGFFDDNKKGADVNKRFSTIQDYLLEYCNFGCAYFVLRRLTEHEIAQHFGADVIIASNDTTELDVKQTESIIDENIEMEIIEETETTVVISEDKTFKYFQK